MKYMEFVGGLGDAILRMYFSGLEWYGDLENLGPDERAKVVLMCHNPYLREAFEWHPKREFIDLVDLGFTTPFHPWENREWRLAHGLPEEAPCPPYAPAFTLKFYPSPADQPVLEGLRLERFIVMAATASTEERTLPVEIRHECAREALKAGFKLLVVGRSSYWRGKREYDVPPQNGVINAIDRLSVPGTIEAAKRAAGVITCHSSVLHMAWSENRPVFLAYNEWMKVNVLSCGPVGYMQGVKRGNTDHMEFSEYTKERLVRWLRERTPNAP